MTKTFKEADETFQELMREVNDKLIGLNGVAISDNDVEKCKDSKDLSWYEKEFERIVKEKHKNEDNINSPEHYITDKGFEVFDVQEAFIHELKGMSASYWCNIVKYILRFQKKNGVEDLKKAKYYLEKLIEGEEKK
ncbi:hypothetical protein Si004_00451 [Streptococcus infantarius subsp. infantarius]|nr:hypothetical protein [Streptococcus infantarius subsp. infantarius]MCO4665392.1 hypothetical protein [Streptococcus infantarius subsp. infantarius]MCO4676305.1 hypothetical protein [Streptococcus infantarius subsp. infantarius]MCO4680430.1 hypothetical protein [Streptococcus infantarius subsp. infantarius]MCO4682909.1 hypothetical protein [Streptococcus infantarius subsp. infantarius]